MAFRRQFTNYVTTLANASDQKFTLTYNDSYRDITVKRIYVGVQSARFAVGLLVSGYEAGRVDTTRFANGNHPVEVDIPVRANETFQLVTNDGAGSAHTNVPIVITYEVATFK